MFIWLFALIIFLLPGLAWLGFSRHPHKDLAEKINLVFGVSAAAYALLALSTYTLDYSLSPWMLWTGWAGLGILVLFRVGTWFLHGTFRLDKQAMRKLLTPIAALVIFAAILALRFYQARELVLPAWVDSVHHTLIVRILLEGGRIPMDLNPYVDVPFYYHFGYHAVAAFVAYLTRLAPEQAVLQFGQVLNAWVPLSLYTLAAAAWGERKRGLAAMVLVGFAFQMPAYYLTWGRYTLLTGIILLAFAMGTAFEIYREGISREKVLRLALFTGALLVTHYLAALMLALFYIILAAGVWLGKTKLEAALTPGRFKGLLMGGAAGAVIALPWIWRVWNYSKAYVRLDITASQADFAVRYSNDYLQYLWYLLGPQRSHILLFAGLAGLVLLGWQKGTRPLAAWSAAFALVSLPWGVNLAPFRPDHGAILAFIPASLMVANLFIRPVESTRKWVRRTGMVLVVAILGLFTWWGVKETRDILNPVTVFATQADLEAIEWAREYIPAGSKFYINVIPWQYGIYRGVDGGWWLPVLTDHATILPPVIFVSGDPQKADLILDNARKAASLTNCSEQLLAFMLNNELGYLYLKAYQGNIRGDSMLNCSFTELIYIKNEVTIYRLIQP